MTRISSSTTEKPLWQRPRRLADWLNPDGQRKVHSLVDKVYQSKNLRGAWEKVKANRGSGGIDGQSLEEFEQGLEEHLGRLHEELRTDRYQPRPVRRVVISKQDRHNVLEGSTGRWGCTQPRDGDKPAGRNASERPMSPVSVYPAGIAARAGQGAAEPPVVGRRLVSAGDESGMRTRRGSRGEGGSMQGQNRGERPETPPGPPARAVGTEDIRPEAEVPRGAGSGSRRGPYERRRAVMRPEQRAPASATLSRGGGTA
jgi:hypothetical protein